MAWVETKWINWTPTVTQSGSVTVTVTLAQYMIIGDTVLVAVRLTVTGSGTIGNVIVIAGQPVAMQPASAGTYYCIGNGMIADSGTAFYNCAVIALTATDWRFMGYSVTNYMGATPSFALASNDQITFTAIYKK